MSKAQNSLICLTALIIGLSGIAVFTAHAAVFIVSVGFIVFSLTYAFFLSREVLQPWLAKNAELKYLLYAIGAAVAAIGILGLVSVFGCYLYSFSTIKTGRDSAKGWLENADYLSAAATIIGAFIALIPIFWLIGQNKKFDEQLRLQREQNNVDIFARACEMIRQDESQSQVNCGLVMLSDILTKNNGRCLYVICSISDEVTKKNIIHSADSFKITFMSITFYTDKIVDGKDQASHLELLFSGLAELISYIVANWRTKIKPEQAYISASYLLSLYEKYTKEYILNICSLPRVYTVFLDSITKAFEYFLSAYKVQSEVSPPLGGSALPDSIFLKVKFSALYVKKNLSADQRQEINKLDSIIDQFQSEVVRSGGDRLGSSSVTVGIG